MAAYGQAPVGQQYGQAPVGQQQMINNNVTVVTAQPAAVGGNQPIPQNVREFSTGLLNFCADFKSCKFCKSLSRKILLHNHIMN